MRARDFGTGRKPRSPHGKITDAAIALGVNPRTLSDALHGRRVPVAELKIALAELLGVSLEECWTPKLLYAYNTGPKGGAHNRGAAEAEK